MRNAIAAVGCVALFGAGWNFGKGQTAKPLPGGTTWNATPQSEREWYVVGFMHGYVLGKRDTAAMMMAKLTENPKLTEDLARRQRTLTPAEKKDFDEGVEEAQKAAHIIGSTSAIILTAAMSTFYNDEQNASVCWEKAVLLSAELLAGNAPTEQELNAARKAGAESACR